MRSPFVVYVDESGDHGLDNIDPESPIFVLCAVLYETKAYLEQEQAALALIKFDHWWHDNVVFHSRAIRKQLGSFSALKDEKKRDRLYDAIGEFFAGSKATLIAAAINKPAHKVKYFTPGNPYFLCVQFVLERVYGEIKNSTKAGQETMFVFESRGRKEDSHVEEWFHSVCAGDNQWHTKFEFRTCFAPKRAGLSGLQVADLAAYPITKHLENPAAKRRDWDAIEPRFRRSPKGEIAGWGLKVFP